MPPKGRCRRGPEKKPESKLFPGKDPPAEEQKTHALLTRARVFFYGAGEYSADIFV